MQNLPYLTCMLGLLALASGARPARAQSPALAGALLGVMQAAGRGGYNYQQDPQLYTTAVQYEDGLFHCKRTPEALTSKSRNATIAAVEQLLASRTPLLRSDTMQILTPAWENAFAQALTQLRNVHPTWSTLAYEEEAGFYRREDEVRHQWRLEVQAVKLRRARRRAQRDSVARLAPPAGPLSGSGRE